MPKEFPRTFQLSLLPPVHDHGIRAYYYTSVTGDSQLLDVADRLRALGFHPAVFKKTRREQKAKGVDITLTKDLLSHAFMGNFQTAPLFSGDGDYVPVVEEVQRLGKRVVVVAFDNNSLNPALRRAADDFHDLRPKFLDRWRRYWRQKVPQTASDSAAPPLQQQ